MAKLNQMEQHLEEYTIQATLCKLRILSRFGGKGHHSLSEWYIDYRLAPSYSLDHEFLVSRYSQIVDIRRGMFDVIISRLDPLSTDRDLFQIFEEIDNLVNSLSKLERLYPTPSLSPLNYYKMLKISMDLILLAVCPSTPVKDTYGGLSSISEFPYGMFYYSISPLLWIKVSTSNTTKSI